MWYTKANAWIKAMLMMSIAFLFNNVHAQTFSKRANDDLLSVYLSVLNQPFGYQTIGARIDTNGGYHFNTIIRNFNFDGDVIETKQLFFPNKTYNPSRDNNARLNDTMVVTVVMDIENGNDTIYSTVVWLTNEGDTIQTRRFSSPYYVSSNSQTNLNLPTTIICSPDGQYIYFVSQIFHSSSQNNFMIKKLTAQGEELWTYVDDLEMWYNSCNVINYFNNQLWFVSQASGEQGHFNKLMSLNDNTGVVDYEIEHNASDFIIGGASDMVLDESGYCVTAPAGNVNSILPFTFKVDFTGEYVWIASPIGDNAPQQQSDHLVKSPDGGYVSCSVKYDEQINPNAPNDPAANNTSEKIWLWKVDSEGNFLWQRFYEYIGFDSGYFYLNNTANDLKATPDGGYIMAGEARANCLEWPCLAGSDFTQQGWLLKVDGCGCLVPGCDEQCVVGVNEQEGEKPSYFKFG
ncbi:MAG: hypothetical protein RLZZ77_45, partial [Bacteroidota bacterium]